MEEVRITLRLPPDLHTKLVTAAKADRRSLNNKIVHLLVTFVVPLRKRVGQRTSR